MKSLDLKDGDIVSGRPIKILTEAEAAEAIGLQAVDQDLIDALYPAKVTQGKNHGRHQETK